MGSYDEARTKILVFGDSWAAFHREGKTWPNFLRETLGRRLGASVHVVNFGRDGYGVLQMFDLAVAKVPEWKPDLVIISFITDDLTRARFWRTVVGKGDDVRVRTTIDPVRHPDPGRSADTSFVFPSATYEWCTSMVGTKRRDNLLEQIVAKYRRLLAEASDFSLANVLTLRHSYLLGRLARGDPFWFLNRLTPPSKNPRVGFTSFASDARFLRDVERLGATGIPYVLFHLAYYPEVKAREEAIMRAQETALWNSLEEVTGAQVLRTTDYVRLPVPAPERMNVSWDDLHPSRWGMEFYANAVADVLVQRRLVRH
jgi:lysophospholipase L1-like esterase